MLAASGERDPFASPAELREHLTAVAGPLTLVTIPGGHAPTDDGGVVRTVARWITGLG